MKPRYCLVYLSIIFLEACGHIESYTTKQIKPDKSFAITPAPDNLKGMDEAATMQWENTYSYCMQKQNAIQMEIAERESKVGGSKTWLLGIGGLASLANVIYTGVNPHPEKSVTIPLVAISGTSLVSLLPGVSSDEKIDELKTKSATLSALHLQAEEAMSELDRRLQTLGIDQDHLTHEADSTKKIQLEKQVEKDFSEQLEAKIALRKVLVSWIAASE